MNTTFNKNKTLLAIALFVIIFVALASLATFYDLNISVLLTKNSLPDGAYYSTNGFGLFFEALGSAPIYIMLAIGATIMFWQFFRVPNKPVKIIFSTIFAILTVVGFYLVFADAFKYVGEIAGNSLDGIEGAAAVKDFMGSSYVSLIELFFGAILAVLTIALWKRVNPDTNKALVKLALVIICTMAAYLAIHFIKGPVGRMRFRTMNALGDTTYSGFTKWFVLNGKRSIDGLPSDCCKSFPSGHTYSAGLIYTLLCLPYLVPKFNTKSWKVSLYFITIGFTGLVAVSRIVVGAHYFSDVLFGGTMSFLAAIFFREIFVCKFGHFKCLKRNNQ